MTKKKRLKLLTDNERINFETRKFQRQLKKIKGYEKEREKWKEKQ